MRICLRLKLRSICSLVQRTEENIVCKLFYPANHPVTVGVNKFILFCPVFGSFDFFALDLDDLITKFL